MRTLILASAAIAVLAFASPVMAQQAPRGGQRHGSGQWHGDGQSHGGGQWQGGSQWRGGHNWGGSIGGRWIGGARAPGGWSAYRRPVRGWALPHYWAAPSFAITDWGDYGLSEPPYGYTWSRYYDDAVLVDQYGRVMDSVGGLDWGGFDDRGYSDRGDRDYDYGHDVGPGAAYPPPGTRVETRSYRYDGAPPPVIVQQGPGCGCYTSGWYYPSATTTTVTVTSMPVTTTTTEYIEEAAPSVVIHRRAVRKWRPAPKPRRHWTPKLTPRHKARCLC